MHAPSSFSTFVTIRASKNIKFIYTLSLLGKNLPNFVNLKLLWYSNVQSFAECPSEIIEDDANFRVFLTINALTIFDWSGNLQQRKLELNWTPPPDGVQNGDWIGNYTSGMQRAKIAEKVHNPRPLGVNVINFEFNGCNAFI